MKRRKLVLSKRERHSSYLQTTAAGHHTALSPGRLVVEHTASILVPLTQVVKTKIKLCPYHALESKVPQH